MNKTLIRMEGLLVLAAAAFFYFSNGYSLGMFLLLLLVPDVFMVGYIINNKIGAYLYNFAHTYTTPLLLLLAGNTILVNNNLTMISLIWLAHIGMDRMLGYGLKYQSGFKDTHIQKI